MQKNGLIYIHDSIQALEHAKISLFDLGVTRGFGIFDYLRTYSGVPFHLEDHLLRFEYSAKEIGLCLPKTFDEIKVIIFQLIKQSQIDNASIKLILTGGTSSDGISFENNPTLAIALFPFQPLISPEQYAKGIGLKTAIHLRPYPYCKTLFYLPAILALKNAKKEGFDDVLFINENKEILESTTSNFFAIKDDVLITPKQDILFGITREVVINLASSEMDVKEQSISYEEIEGFDEAFITASNKEIVPVVRIDEICIKDGKVGKQTKQLIQTFSKYAKKLETVLNL